MPSPSLRIPLLLLLILTYHAIATPMPLDRLSSGDKALGFFTQPLVGFVHFFVRSIIFRSSRKDERQLRVEALNLPGYGNWTEQGWNLHVHGNIYRRTQASWGLFDFWSARFMLLGPKVKTLTQPELDGTRNITAELLTLPVKWKSVYDMKINIHNTSSINVSLPPTINTGDYDGWLALTDADSLAPGTDIRVPLQQVGLEVVGADNSMAAGWLVPDHGITVVSDIDDILRESKIWQWKHMIKSAFAEDFEPWENIVGGARCSIKCA
jgi:hypothetical protein